MSRTVVVTGGAGFIGSNTVERLVQRGDNVRVVDNLSTGYRENLEAINGAFEFIDADINDAGALARAFKGAEVVFHQAALASVPLSVEQPLRVNQACVNGTLNVLDQARRANVRRVVYSSTSACYGDRPFAANRETDIPQTISPYAVAKLAGEYYCQAFHSSYGLETVSLRYFNVFGPRQDPNSHYSAVIPLFITRILDGKRPIIYGDGSQSRDFTFVGNVVDANLLAADAKNVSGKAFNIADGRSITVLDLILHLSDALGIAVQPEFQAPRSGDILHSMADISSAIRDLGYTPNTDFKTGIRLSIDFYKAMALQGI